MPVPFVVAAVLILKGILLLAIFWGGTIVGDHRWPWESRDSDDDDPFNIPLPEEAKKALAGLLLLGALILGATLLKGRK